MDTIEIVIASPDRGYTWDAWVEGEHLGRFKEPLTQGARALLKAGADPEARLSLRHEGQPHPSLRSTVGYAAKLSVKDDARGTPRFIKYEPWTGIKQLNNNEAGSEPVVEREGVGGTQTAPDHLARAGDASGEQEMAS